MLAPSGIYLSTSPYTSSLSTLNTETAPCPPQIRQSSISEAIAKRASLSPCALALSTFTGVIRTLANVTNLFLSSVKLSKLIKPSPVKSKLYLRQKKNTCPQRCPLKPFSTSNSNLSVFKAFDHWENATEPQNVVVE